MDPMFLPEVEAHDDPGARGDTIRRMKAAGVMPGPSPLSPGQRELIAAFTSYRNSCPF